jgi:hypothetical protein
MGTHRPARRLGLSRETVRELNDVNLVGVGGAFPPPTPVLHTVPLDQCVSVFIASCQVNTNCLSITVCDCTGTTGTNGCI